MTSKVPEIRVYSPATKSNVICSQYATRFTWHAPKGDDIRQLKSQQPQRFFGSSHLDIQSGTRCQKSVEMVKWENTFHMRAQTLNNFLCGSNYRSTYRSQAVAMQRARLGFIGGTTKTLDILRQNLQMSINKEIDEILQKYVQRFFKLAMENVKLNNGENTVSDHLQTVCRQILEEAKKMYQGTYMRGNSPLGERLELDNPAPDVKVGRNVQKSVGKKRRDSDTDSEASVYTVKRKRKKGRPPLHYQGPSSGRSTPVKFNIDHIKREGPKWDPYRLATNTLFIMGAKANKALGLGATRGRLYIKHPNIFKYSGDQSDKQWLYDHKLMPATGGKAYMLLVEDIKELAESDEYKNNPALLLDEIVGFTVPESMLQKMRNVMQQMRTDIPLRKRGRPPVVTKTDDTSPVCGKKYGDEVTPTDELDLNEMHSREDPSPYSIGTSFGDASPSHADISPTPSDMSTTALEPPLTASFEVNTTP